MFHLAYFNDYFTVNQGVCFVLYAETWAVVGFYLRDDAPSGSIKAGIFLHCIRAHCVYYQGYLCTPVYNYHNTVC
jgi:hypothetical protein